MSASSITTIPTLSQLTIFDKLPLHRLLHIDEVCRAWGGDVKLAALARRTQLVIVQCEYDLENLKLPPYSDCDLFRLVKEDDGSPYKGLRLSLQNHALILEDMLTLPTVAMLTWCLPNLKVIHIVQDEVNFSMLLSISSLLDRYRHKLTELTVKVTFDDVLPKDVVKKNEAQTAASHFFNSFCQSLNCLTALTSLELSLNAWHGALQLPLAVLANTTHLAAVIGRVKSLYLRLYCFEESFNGYPLTSGVWLRPYIEVNEHLKALYCPNLEGSLKDMTKQGAVSLRQPRAAAALQSVRTIDELYRNSDDDGESALQAFLCQYHDLLELNVHTWNLSMLELARSLTVTNAFHSLVRLEIIGFDINEEPSFGETIIPELPSLKVLSLHRVKISNHKDFERIHLAELFPNVQVIALTQDYSQCEDCDYDLRDEPKKVKGREEIRRRHALIHTIHKCLGKSRHYFARFVKLTRLEVNYFKNKDIQNTPDFDSLISGKFSFTKETLNKVFLCKNISCKKKESDDNDEDDKMDCDDDKDSGKIVEL